MGDACPAICLRALCVLYNCTKAILFFIVFFLTIWTFWREPIFWGFWGLMFVAVCLWWQVLKSATMGPQRYRDDGSPLQHRRRAREAVPDLSTDASIQIAPQQVSEGATSSLMSNQATPDVCIEAVAPVQVPVLPNGPAEAVSPLETQSVPRVSSV